MNITIFGASRGVGRAAVAIAAGRGHVITSVARDVSALDGLPAVAIAGDILDPAIAAQALHGAQAVLVALGSPPVSGGGPQARVCSLGTRIIIDGMRAADLRRIVVVSSYGVGPTRARRPFPFSVVAATLLKDVMADKELQEAEVRASDSDWTIVQPLGLTDDAASNSPFVSADGSRKSSQVARADVAALCLNAIERAQYICETVAVSGR